MLREGASTRRSVIFSMTALAACDLPFVRACVALPVAVGMQDARRLELLALSVFPNPETARSIGVAYLREQPGDASRDRLAQALFAGLSRISGAAVAETIGERRARDLVEGDIVVVEGWVLARTEVRLCAFVALAG